MIRVAIVLLLSLSCCLVAPALRADDELADRKDRDRQSRERDLDASREDNRKDDGDKKQERERRKKRKERKPKDAQSEKSDKKPPDDAPAEMKKPKEKKKPREEKPKDKKPEDKKPDEKSDDKKPAEPKPADEPKSPQPEPTEPTPAEPTPAEPKLETPQPTAPAEEKVEPLPTPAEKVEAAKPEAAPSDVDFELQGEYLGTLNSGPHAGRTGLQVVALGDGKFDVYVLQGGLPGNGWLRGSPRPKMSGERDGEKFIARGEMQIDADGKTARVTDASGRELGVLNKVLRRSATMGAAPAVGAKVLFGGNSTEAFKSAKLTEDGLLGVGALTKDPVGDFRLHLEFRTPFEPAKRGQGRGNSGVYIQERYEVQVLDSFGLAGDASECAGLYRQRKPDFNLCLPPMSWQTYDIRFTAARYDAQGNKSANARITVFHNGIAVHDNVELTGKTGAGQKEEPTERPIRLQDHGNAVVYRNIWIVAGQGSANATPACCGQQ